MAVCIETVGNPKHPHPKALVFCMCCGATVEGAGHRVSYAPDTPPDIFCSEQCCDAHEGGACKCAWN